MTGIAAISTMVGSGLQLPPIKVARGSEPHDADLPATPHNASPAAEQSGPEPEEGDKGNFLTLFKIKISIYFVFKMPNTWGRFCTHKVNYEHEKECSNLDEMVLYLRCFVCHMKLLLYLLLPP
jgi:hypothetical protein